MVFLSQVVTAWFGRSCTLVSSFFLAHTLNVELELQRMDESTMAQALKNIVCEESAQLKRQINADKGTLQKNKKKFNPTTVL